MFKTFHKNKYNSGVTLVELLVVISILAIMSATTLMSYSKFRSNMSIQNLADDIALTIRKAQGYAIGVHNYYSGSYGVHFTVNNKSPSYLGSNKAFVLFANINDTSLLRKYNQSDSSCGSPTSVNECLEVLGITSSDVIQNIYWAIPRATGGFREYKVDTLGSVDIFFNRPNPEPIFCHRSNANSSTCNDDTAIVYIKIQVYNPSNPTVYKMITIRNNGQIDVQ